MEDAPSDAPLDAIFGAAFDFDAPDTPCAPEDRRALRFRAGFEHARATYRPKVDDEAWFFANGVTDDPSAVESARSMDAKTSQQLQACLMYLYYRKHYDGAYQWACALLRRLHALPDTPDLDWLAAGVVPSAPPQTKHAKALSGSAVARESLDIALRCLIHTHPANAAWTWTEVDRSVLLAAFHKVRLDPSAYNGLLVEGNVDDDAAKRCLWTPLPGLAMSLGEVCLRGGYTRGAIEALALVLGVRGTQWRALSLTARACALYANETHDAALRTLAHACLACALQVCTPARRVVLAREVLAGELIPLALLPDPVRSPAAVQPGDAVQDAVLLRTLAQSSLSEATAVAIVHSALRRRGGATALALRLPSYLFSAQELLAGRDTQWTADDDDAPADMPRSVKTL
ncbi:hypothetical protein MBRA1_001836 [Malassezia brasiliensis]|uniref:Ig-like domain-containing protein n=1 Tax=Malassezia brasiliensis TaxID=1821822 RepID=A0AAF0INK6_9BASI|nr:hypothetical protein MBRA1_001836 [Malassezia brasiliensis]